MSSPDQPGKLWGGRFAGKVDPEIHRFTHSLPCDCRLVRHDLIGSLAHARMLYETGILDRDSATAILEGLSELLRRVEAGELEAEGDEEDVHSWIEARLVELVGDPGRRLHTARSRNDQTSTALRLYLRQTLRDGQGALLELCEVWLGQAEEHVATVLPGYTHLQRGQPTSLAHHLLAHFWALLADAHRFQRVHLLSGTSPLGAGAMVGTPHPISPKRCAELLGWPGTYPNSMLAVADRDYVLDAAFACTLVMLHLSRWAAEVILWTTSEFGFATLDDTVAKGSSLMPQKKNPEAAEILRGKTGRVVGDLSSLLILVKGLELTYNSDLQEDKQALFDALDTVGMALPGAAALSRGLRFNVVRMQEALHGSFVTATDLADGLVRRGVPFRSAHEQTGRAVRAAEALGVELWELPLAELQKHCPEADSSIFAGLSPQASLEAHNSPGAPAPARVVEQLEAARGELAAARDWIARQATPPIYQAYLDDRLLEEPL